MRILLFVLGCSLALIPCSGCDSAKEAASQECASSCPEIGTVGCSGSALVVCTNPTGNCQDWQVLAACSQGCDNARCLDGATCQDECPSADTRGCRGSTLVACMLGDGCLKWIDMNYCTEGCQNAQCVEQQCEPSCSDRECGEDGCGGSCGTCADGATCNGSGKCETSCVPNCSGRECGNDGCGGSCGTCLEGKSCNDGTCCKPICDERTCGDDGCGGSCGACDPRGFCNLYYVCVCHLETTDVPKITVTSAFQTDAYHYYFNTVNGTDRRIRQLTFRIRFLDKFGNTTATDEQGVQCTIEPKATTECKVVSIVSLPADTTQFLGSVINGLYYCYQ